jgi:predicted AlkP superfamily pyrophosphatase or phosphodiesterase
MKPLYSPTHSLVNLSNTLLAHFGVQPFHAPIASLLKRLKGKKKIAVLLFDGMGQNILRQHVSMFHWLRRHRWGGITSTFPSTTAAATNAFLSGRYPIEIGWFGWAHYFPEYDAFIELFTGRDYLKQQPLLSPLEAQKDIGYPSILELIQKQQPHLTVSQVWPNIKPGGAATLESWWQQLEDKLLQTKEGITYGYWLDPDKSIHALGVKHSEVKRIVNQIANQLKVITQKHPDTTFIVFADHGLVDIEFLNIQAHPDLFNLLKRSFAFEPRAATFFVKPGQQDYFKKLFKRYYGPHFLLLTKAEALMNQIYGLGNHHPRVHDFIGDFIAISQSKYAFTHGTMEDQMPNKMKAHHAGITQQEMKIDVMVMND